MCQPAPSSETLPPEISPPLMPRRQPINPANSMWLNNDYEYDINDTNHDDVTMCDSICTSIGDTFDNSAKPIELANISGKQTHDTNELIMLLLEAVEKLSEIVLGDKPAKASTPVTTTPLKPSLENSQRKFMQIESI